MMNIIWIFILLTSNSISWYVLYISRYQKFIIYIMILRKYGSHLFCLTAISMKNHRIYQKKKNQNLTKICGQNVPCKGINLAKHKMRVSNRLHGKSFWKHFLMRRFLQSPLCGTIHCTLYITSFPKEIFRHDITFTSAFIIGDYGHTLRTKSQRYINKLIMYFLVLPLMLRWKWKSK